ncbi:MauE/DoxX family redox-associated membrane protein [Planctomycetota bacterium]
MKKADKIVMTVVGAVLLIATILKAHQLLTEPILSKGFWESWEFFLIQIPLELGLAIWLMCGLFRKAGWLIAVFAFGIFIGVTLHKGIIGVESCGCFGRVHVDPWITLFSLDIPIFLALLVFRPKGCKLLPPPWPSVKHFFGVAIPTFAAIGIVLPVLIFNKPPLQTAQYEVLEADRWVNKELPIFENIDIGEELSTGVSFILFYHNDCPDCRVAIPEYDRMARDYDIEQLGLKFAFIEGPPFDTEEKIPIPGDTPCFSGQLDEQKDWLFTSPLMILTLEGVVIKGWEVETPSFEQIFEALGGI